MSLELFLMQNERVKPNEKSDNIKKLIILFENIDENIEKNINENFQQNLHENINGKNDENINKKNLPQNLHENFNEKNMKNDDNKRMNPITNENCAPFLDEILKLINGPNQIMQISALQLLKSANAHVRNFIPKSHRKNILSALFKRISDTKTHIRELANENLRKYSFLIDLYLFDFLANQVLLTKNLSQKEFGLKFLDEFAHNNFSFDIYKIFKNLISKCVTDSSYKIRELSDSIGKNLAKNFSRQKNIYNSFRGPGLNFGGGTAVDVANNHISNFNNFSREKNNFGGNAVNNAANSAVNSPKINKNSNFNNLNNFSREKNNFGGNAVNNAANMAVNNPSINKNFNFNNLNIFSREKNNFGGSAVNSPGMNKISYFSREKNNFGGNAANSAVNSGINSVTNSPSINKFSTFPRENQFLGLITDSPHIHLKRKLSNDVLDRTITPVKETFYSQKNSRQTSPEPRKPISINTNKKKSVSKQDLIDMWSSDPTSQLMNFKAAIPELHKINETISKTENDWLKRVMAMKNFRGIVKKFARTDVDLLANQINHFFTAFLNSVKDLRSKVNMEMFATIAFVSVNMHDKNYLIYENLLPSILPLFTSSPLSTTSSAFSCLEIVLTNCRSTKMLIILKENVTSSKSVPIRRRCALLFTTVVSEWDVESLEKNSTIFESVIKTGITDADSEVRTTLSLTFWQYYKILKKCASSLYSMLTDREKNILRNKCPSSIFDMQNSFNNSHMSIDDSNNNFNKIFNNSKNDHFDNQTPREIKETKQVEEVKNIPEMNEVKDIKDNIKVVKVNEEVGKVFKPDIIQNVSLPEIKLFKKSEELKKEPDTENVLLPKPLIAKFESFNIDNIKNQENLDQTQLDSSNMMYGPAGFTPFIPKSHSSDKSHKIKGDDLVLEMKFEILYIDLQSNEKTSILTALEKLSSIFKNKRKISISHISKLLSSLENLLLNEHEDVIILALDVIILFVTSYHLEPFDWLGSLMKKVLSLSKRDNFSEISTKTEQLIHVLQTVINDEAIVKCFLDFFQSEHLKHEKNKNFSYILNIFCNLLMNISELDNTYILDMVFQNILQLGIKQSTLTTPEFQNVFKKIAGINEIIFQKFYDSLTIEKRKEISHLFNGKCNNNFTISVLEENITVRKHKSLSEGDVDSAKKQISKNTDPSLDLSTSNLESLLLNIKEITCKNSDDKNNIDALLLIKSIIQQKSTIISSQISIILDIIGFYIKNNKDSQDLKDILDSLISILSIAGIISSINPKLSISNLTENQGILSILRYILLKCDQKNSKMIEIIEILPKLLCLWMSELSDIIDVSLDCLSKIHSVIGHDRFNLFTLSLPMEKKKSLYQCIFEKKNNVNIN